MPLPLDPLDAATIRKSVMPTVQRGAKQIWSIQDLGWDRLAADRLTDLDRSVVRYITYIEDHLPGYLDWLLRVFPAAGMEHKLGEYIVNREYFRFFVAWACDEERHADALTRYQVAAGIADSENDLLADLAVEGIKPFALPYQHPIQVFTYMMIQEKATQLFYQRFMDTVKEPVLRELLRLMARDEARHFSLYARLVSEYLARDGSCAVPCLRDVIATFRMPLATTLARYRQWSLQIADGIGYDHTEAYAALSRLIAEFAGRGGTDADAFHEFALSLRALA